MHYRRQLRSGDPGEAVPRYAVKGSTKSKPCSKCGGVFLLMDFPRCTNKRRSSYCATCYAEREDRRREMAALNETDRWRAKNIARYGITLEQYETLLEAQGHRCALCNTDTPGGPGRFHVDHCHDTQRIRGLLCTRCNVGIGMLNHDTATLRRAIEYLN